MNMLIPSLFCFMIFSNFIMKTKLKRVISFPLEKLFSKAFRLNSCESTIYLLSLIGGYPIGAKLISDLYAKGEIKKEKAERLLAFFVNCGPSFLISGIGAGLLGNVKIGVIIYLSELLASFIIGFIITRKTDISVSKTNESPSADFGIALTESVVDATKTMILICAYSVFFSAVLPLIMLFCKNFPQLLLQIISGVLEVTNGCFSMVADNAAASVLLLTGFTAFGGICVIFQIYSIVNQSGLSLLLFLKYRFLYTAISVSLVYLYLRLFPSVTECMAINSAIRREIYTVSPLASIFLIILSLMLLFFQRKSAKINV